MAPLPLAIALLSAALMGLAIQRGATCMVAAVDEALSRRRFARGLALAEAAVWVGGLSALAQYAGLLDGAFAQFPLTSATLAGGMLLGLGAWINRACVFGSVARIGNGQLAWLTTPLGFFLGCLAPIARPVPINAGGTLPFPAFFAAAFFLLLAWRLIQVARGGDFLCGWWEPYRATLIIAVTFVVAMLTAGMWAYTDALDDLARSQAKVDPMLKLRSAMVVALFAGAVLGGRLAQTAVWERPRPAIVLRCLGGGALMGMGAALVPGSNDGLILLGLPLLMPHALAAVAIMTATIALAIMLTRERV